MKSFLIVLTLAGAAMAQPVRWTEKAANEWYAKQPWLVGSNYLPSTAINQLEMWQADTFDPDWINTELSWAEDLGMTTMRVFLHDLPWKQDSGAFKGRIDKFLSIADHHKIKPIFVLFDSCWDPYPDINQPRAPKPGVHNSGWVQSPGAAALRDPAQAERLRTYVQEMIGAYRFDKRVLAWDLWNEPDNVNQGSYQKLEPPIGKVQYYSGATLLGESTTAPYDYTWGNISAGSYLLRATAIYDAGSAVDSPAVSVLVVNPMPTVVLTSPANQSSYALSTTIPLVATVASNGHTLTKVQFYNGTTLLNEDKVAPYAYNWGNAKLGSYTLKARLVFNTGTILDSATVSVTVTSPPPVVKLTAPTGNLTCNPSAKLSLGATVTANSHTITKVQFYANDTLISEDPSSGYTGTWSNLAAGTYSVIARAIYDQGSTAESAPVTVSVVTLPAPWQTRDIGTVKAITYAAESNGVFTVSGAGNISGSGDNFRFAYQSLSGDGEITARLTGVAAISTGQRSGVMIRESLATGSRYAFLGLAASGNIVWQTRTNTTSSTYSGASAIGTPPNVWVRLVRAGNDLSCYKSSDGVTWTLVITRPVPMASEIYAGLAVTSGYSGTLNRSTFDNVNVTP